MSHPNFGLAACGGGGLVGPVPKPGGGFFAVASVLPADFFGAALLSCASGNGPGEAKGGGLTAGLTSGDVPR